MMPSLQHSRVFSKASPRAFYTEPVWLLAIARSHLGLGLAALGEGGGLSFSDLLSRQVRTKNNNKQIMAADETRVLAFGHGGI